MSEKLFEEDLLRTLWDIGKGLEGLKQKKDSMMT